MITLIDSVPVHILRLMYWFLLPVIFVYNLTRTRAEAEIIYKGKILQVKNRFGAGQWQLPGGAVDKDEKPDAAILRELEEELKLSLSPTNLNSSKKCTYFSGGLIYKSIRYQVVLLNLKITPSPEVVQTRLYRK